MHGQEVSERRAALQILGDRELLHHEVVRELACAADAKAGPRFLHIVVRLADIKSVRLSTATGRQLSFNAGAAAARQRRSSALTAALASGNQSASDR
jgi:hypothetical protein